MGSPEDADVLTLARRILEYHPVCNRCLGRQFAWLSTDTSNEERGYSLKLTLSMMADNDVKAGRRNSGLQLVTLLADNGMFEPARVLAERNSIELLPEKTCSLCSVGSEHLFDSLAEVAKIAKAATDGIEFNTFLVGSIPSPYLLEREDEIRSGLKIMHGETLRADLNRELGKHLQKIIDKPVDFDHPDIVVIYDMAGDRIEVRINPIFIAGRYRKLVRGIPQSRWDCKPCRGKGCDKCGGTGRKYPDSISEYIGIPAQDLAKGTKFKFHAAGREDIDVRMLGSGRPFVIEVSEPRVRTPDLKKLEKRIKKGSSKKLEVLGLEISTRKRAQALKDEAAENVKDYEATIKTEKDVSQEVLTIASDGFRDLEISQRTPTRVAHRRSDLVRTKRIYEMKLRKIGSNVVKGFFKVQGGTYVKELVSGDNGRTTPSISERIDTACECIELDVLEING
ncbi:MAG: tRNA pseudouridine(54/55) synthase Pus10 [Candidatus Sifarchaeia archaeon]